MLLAKEMGAQNLLVKSDSQLITGQVTGEFQAKDPQMAAYLKYVQLLKGAFNAFELIHVPREQNAARYTLVDGVLFRHGFTHPILTCVSGDECTRIMAELHEGICGSHVGGRSLASKVIRAGFFWPTVKEDCTRHA